MPEVSGAHPERRTPRPRLVANPREEVAVAERRVRAVPGPPEPPDGVDVARFDDLVRRGTVVAPDRPKGPPPERVHVEGGLSGYVLAERE